MHTCKAFPLSQSAVLSASPYSFIEETAGEGQGHDVQEGEPGLEVGGWWEKVAPSVAGSWGLREADSQGGQGKPVWGEQGAQQCVHAMRV